MFVVQLLLFFSRQGFISCTSSLWMLLQELMNNKQ